MNKHTQLCALESLNTDVLITILSACDSFSDLASIIRASPTLLHAFLSAKARVLLHVASNILGPATRDAALLAQTSRFDKDTHEELERAVDAAVLDYRARLHVANAPWVTMLDADTAVALTHVTRLAQFFVDLFVYFRFRYFGHELDVMQANFPPAQPRLSRTEHGRIAQAILRRQLIVYIHGGKYSRPLDYPRFVRMVFSLFQTWELEQISDMDHFLGQLLVSLADYQMRKRGPNGERSPVRWQFWDTHYAPELEEFAKKMKSMLDSDNSLLDRLCQWDVFSGHISASFGLFDMFKGSHRFTIPSPSHGSQQSSSNLGTADSRVETSTSSEPWAWKDALRGHETCRWGCDLVKAPPPDSANQQDYEQAKSALESWRWFGMVFWDRERAEQLKQSSALKSCKSGWLVPWQN
ncbi:uncharacterized protein TRIVIDRAFT_201627 [Trichoderma virens Gv29-8]|uniref:Uncharacterized protein n=1 Tax=Hypocrea virens (strain Gv29-8 / FGSC 10586) TaxID=413071 RepID=G9MUJ0_HYPVG|nr:uncharacterized protein TRIVIDRAFT_201627 [Trichoderma virens Gv29-8]EHK21903.1 hypothetical protein TRIVIDRAFT_201627 [Trichoderma virens Gv29-8]